MALSLANRPKFPHRRRPADAKLQSILIPVDASKSQIPWEMVDVASRLAAERRAVIDLLAFSRVPLSEELDLEIPGLEARLRGLLAQTQRLAAGYGVRVRCTHLRTRDAAAAILQQAERGGSQLILLGATDGAGTGYRRLARDGTARRVAAQSRVPVMFVRPSPEAA
jgi:nucleotide-binding universal stress UspA family protein